jgi:hypothetical protein
MAARVPSVLNAAIELGFVAVAGILGFARAPLWTLPALAAAMIVYWAINRRAGLAQAREAGIGRLVGVVVVSLVMMSAVLGGIYWIGTIVGGATA